MNWSLFKFSIETSSQMFKKNIFLFSRHINKTDVTLYHNNYIRHGKILRYFHVNSKTFCSFHDGAENNEQKTDSEIGSFLDIKVDVAKVPKRINVLEPASEADVDFIAPQIRPTFNLAAYANKSEVLKHLIQLGVEIGVWDKDKEICANILNKDLENDIKPYIFFLHNNGIPVEKLGNWLTKNPHIFEQTLENLQVRINYLESRKFKKENISQIITRVPSWLNYSVIDVDRQLGNFQKRFNLSYQEVIEVASKDPKLIIYVVQCPFLLERHTRIIEGQLGFSKKEQKSLLLGNPRLYRTTLGHIINRFEVLHNEMNLSHEVISAFPNVLGLRERKLQERHRFLKFLGKNQYNPAKPGYISPMKFVSGSDAEFSTNVAMSNIEMFNDFLKTL